MNMSLGMSTGAAGVGSALVTTDSNGSQSVEFRYLSADEAHTDLGDLVRSSISLMTTQVPADPATPDAFAVTYRTPEQAHSIRSAVSRQRHRVHLVPEAAATLTYLRHTGEIAQHATVAIVDFGESGLSVSVVDQVDGTVLHADRTAQVSGSAIDDLVFEYAVANLATPHHLRHLDRELLSERCRVAKEQLSTDLNATVDVEFRGMAPIRISRSAFEDFAAPVIRVAVEFVRSTVADSPRAPEAIALVGGGANIPALRAAVRRAFTARVVAVPEPESATAKGAALLAVSKAIEQYPPTESTRPSSTAKVSGALVGALVVGGLVLGYGVRELAPAPDPNVAPAGSDTFHTSQQHAPSTDTPAATRIPSYDPTPTSDFTPEQGVPTTSSSPGWDRSAARMPDSTTSTTPPTTTPPAPTTTPAPTPRPPTDPTQPDWPHIEWPAIPPLWPQVPGESTPDQPSPVAPLPGESAPPAESAPLPPPPEGAPAPLPPIGDAEEGIAVVPAPMPVAPTPAFAPPSVFPFR
ncbi:Hsp70 family protein [Rhodococcus oxybenzonivorans]|uniref:Hsp70 family protein n=1 Tax=Rhodococcus oxybenzonivorans TaxID=1990687 RepID=UPI0029553D18|nr:Hsp70 family protein [Rhodococcus oxybenzonivorans]MDV7355650.1 Hsp70 family protein [Rhodococcus oxybenzonivorans]